MTTLHQPSPLLRCIFICIVCGCLVRLAGCVAIAQTPPPVVRVTNALPEIVVNGGAIRHWTVNGREFAIFVSSNLTRRAVVTLQSPRLGGLQTNDVITVTLTTNAVRLISTNGIASYLLLPSAAQVIKRKAFVITGLQTTTNLTEWTDVGWFCDLEPQRYFRVATNGLALKFLTLTN